MRPFNTGDCLIEIRGGSRGGAPGMHPTPPKIGKNMIFWHKIVIFHTKYPPKNCASLRWAGLTTVKPV
jgi:hypothetical protein